MYMRNAIKQKQRNILEFVLAVELEHHAHRHWQFIHITLTHPYKSLVVFFFWCGVIS